jgi:addiction module HigA family antidote
VLREDVLPALDMSVTEAAAALMISRQTLHRALAGKAAVSPEMALRLRKVLRERSGNLAQDAAGVRPMARAEYHRR